MHIIPRTNSMMQTNAQISPQNHFAPNTPSSVGMPMVNWNANANDIDLIRHSHRSELIMNI